MNLEKTGRIAVCLTSLKAGFRGRVVAIEGDASLQQRLRELGVLERSVVRVIHVNGSILCQVNDSRFGLDRKTAEKVLVHPVK